MQLMNTNKSAHNLHRLPAVSDLHRRHGQKWRAARKWYIFLKQRLFWTYQRSLGLFFCWKVQCPPSVLCTMLPAGHFWKTTSWSMDIHLWIAGSRNLWTSLQRKMRAKRRVRSGFSPMTWGHWPVSVRIHWSQQGGSTGSTAFLVCGSLDCDKRCHTGRFRWFHVLVIRYPVRRIMNRGLIGLYFRYSKLKIVACKLCACTIGPCGWALQDTNVPERAMHFCRAWPGRKLLLISWGTKHMGEC